MKTHELESELRERLKGAGLEDPGFETRALLCQVLSVEPADLVLMHEGDVAEKAVARAREWCEKRAAGVPLAYLTGVKGFYKFEFFVKPGVLVPRPETEIVVEEALKRVAEEKLKVLALGDLGCGTGCIGLSLLSELHDAELFAIDASEVACEVTLKNAQSLQAEELITVINRKVEEWQPAKPMQLVVANPPYIPENDPNVQKSVHDHEPHAALYSGADGLDAIRTWTEWASRHLAVGGLLVYEIGAGQSAAVKEIIAQHGFADIRSRKDLAGIERVVSAKVPVSFFGTRRGPKKEPGTFGGNNGQDGR